MVKYQREQEEAECNCYVRRQPPFGQQDRLSLCDLNTAYYYLFSIRRDKLRIIQGYTGDGIV